MRLATRFLSELRIRFMADFVLANGLVSPFDNPNRSTESHYTSKFRICPMPRMKVCTLSRLCYTQLILQSSGGTEDGNPLTGRGKLNTSGYDDRVPLKWQCLLDI